MKSLKMMGRILALVLMASTFAGRADAATISIVPGSQNALIGDLVSVDIVVSGLLANESVGGVSLLLSFTNILSGAGFTIDPGDAMGFDLDPVNNDFGSGFTGVGGSPLELFFLADASLNHAELKALQGVSFTLATVTFNAVANGISPLILSTVAGAGAIFLSNADGAALPAQAVNGSVCIGPECGVSGVPEPTSLSLLGIGLSLVAMRMRKANKARAVRS